MYRRVLVAVDGSEMAEAVLPFILAIAQPLGLDVVLLRVNPRAQPDLAEAARLMSQAYVADLAKEVEAAGVRVTTSVRDGVPVDEILAAARDEGADLIAMTTHGRTGPSRLLFGSVAEGVLREATVPVLVMRQTQRDVERRRIPVTT
jgi:nucleotide-binding universal stress UspA family protein